MKPGGIRPGGGAIPGGGNPGGGPINGGPIIGGGPGGRAGTKQNTVKSKFHETLGQNSLCGEQ